MKDDRTKVFGDRGGWRRTRGRWRDDGIWRSFGQENEQLFQGDARREWAVCIQSLKALCEHNT